MIVIRMRYWAVGSTRTPWCYQHLDWPRDVIFDSKITNYQWSHDFMLIFLIVY